MGFAKAVKEAILRPFRSTNVQHFHAGSGTTAKKHHGADHGKTEIQTAPKTQPAPARSAWKRKSKRKTMFLTPVPEEKDEQITEEKTSAAAPKSEAAYVDSASGIGLGVTGGSSQSKKTHILIDLRELTKAINDPDGEQDSSDDNLSVCHAHAMPPSQFVKRNSLRASRSARKRVNVVSVKTKQGRSSPATLAATQPSHGKPTSGKQSMTDASTMAMVDDIMQSEIKLDFPYLTKENVDTSLPGSTTISQRANIEGASVPRPLIVPKEASKLTDGDEDRPADDDDDLVLSTAQATDEGVHTSYPSQASIQIQRSKSFSGHESLTQSPMKIFRKHNVTDITIHDVTSAGILISGENPVNFTPAAGSKAVHSNHVHGESESNCLAAVRPAKHVAVDSEAIEGKRRPEARTDIKKEVTFATDRLADQETRPVHNPRPTDSLFRASSSSSLSKPILAHSSTPVITEQQKENANGTADEDIPTTEAKAISKKSVFMRSKSARTYRSVDVAQKVSLKDVLPKTSFFSCHEKSLTEAGYNVKELEKAARLVRIKRSHSKKGKDGHYRSSPTPTERPKAAYKVHVELKRSKSFMSLTKSTKRKQKSKLSDDGDDYSDSEIVVNPAPLLQYLQLVVERPREYTTMRERTASFTTTAISSHHSLDSLRRTNETAEARRRTDSLIELNKAFRKCQANFSPPESLVLQALNDLGSKRWDLHPLCAKYEAYKRARHQINKTKRHPLIHNRDNVTQLSCGATPDDLFDPSKPEMQLTELEKARGEVEQWLKTLSMAQVIKAKEIALHTFGEDQASFSHWWNTNKHCRYIRQAVAAEAT